MSIVQVWGWGWGKEPWNFTEFLAHSVVLSLICFRKIRKYFLYLNFEEQSELFTQVAHLVLHSILSFFFVICACLISMRRL